ncbi:MAG: UDP binding domain-containing protein, partial [Pseudomonadota bacterium]
RRINDGMGAWMAKALVRAMIDRDLKIKGARVLVLGLAFKEDVPDLRNTRVVDVVTELQDYGVRVDVHDPMVNPADARRELGLETVQPEQGAYDAVVVAVPHTATRTGGLEAILSLMAGSPLILDVKGILPREPFILRV